MSPVSPAGNRDTHSARNSISPEQTGISTSAPLAGTYANSLQVYENGGAMMPHHFMNHLNFTFFGAPFFTNSFLRSVIRIGAQGQKIAMKKTTATRPSDGCLILCHSNQR